MNNNVVSVILFKLLVATHLLSVALAQFQPATYYVYPPPTKDKWDGYAMLKKVAACESTGSVENEPRQFNSDGSILWGHERDGRLVKRDVGILQINIEAHGEEIKKLGLDVINNEDDNITYGKILFDREGLKPWFPSKSCWSKS